MNRRNLPIAFVLLALIALGVTARVADHAPNFTPLVAISLLSGCLIGRRALAASIPLTVMAIADLFFIGIYDPRVMLTVYIALALPAILRPVTRQRLSAPRVGIAALAGGVCFFLATNLAHWAFMGMYTMDAAGLLAAYAAALPFLKYQVAGDLFWSATLFGGYTLAVHVPSASLRYEVSSYEVHDHENHRRRLHVG